MTPALMNALLIGIDGATDDVRIGLALAEYTDGIAQLRDCTSGAPDRHAVDIVAEWLQRSEQPRLLALDAPLGWPAPLSEALSTHRAGERIDTPADRMFQRETDRFVRCTLARKPLEIGADRIARTAHAALRLLGALRDRINAPVPLLWGSTFSGIAAIEVYPAATLVAHGYRFAGYKQPERVAERQDIVASLSTAVRVGAFRAALEDDAHRLDAVVCVLAAKDFLDGRAMPPEDRRLAEQEGWIWVAPRLPAP
jgi:predicted RNase H-like nuclease